MKKANFTLISIMLLCLSFLAGCGSQGDDTWRSGISLPGQEGQGIAGLPNSEGSIGAPVSSKEEQDVTELPDTVDKSETVLVGAQFYQGEFVEIRSLRKSVSGRKAKQDIYLYDSLGNATLAVENAARAYEGKWYFTEEGYCLAFCQGSLIRIEPDGTEIFNKAMENEVVDICQLADGRIMMITKDTTAKMNLVELNPNTGAITKFDKVLLTNDRRQYIAAGENDLLLLNPDGFWDVNLENGELTVVRSWDGYDYSLGYLVQDFCLKEGGIIELLQYGADARVETLLPANIKEIRTVITLWDLDGSEQYQELVDLFNNTNLTYYVEVQEFKLGEDKEAFLKEHEEDISNGEGADIITSNAVNDVYGLIHKGIFEDLTPYIESTGIFPDDYFSGAFRYRDGEAIHGISIYASAEALSFSEKLFEDGEVPDEMEVLVDALLNYTGDEVFHSEWGSKEVLEYFLCGSEDLWGILDWNNSTCDFDGVLFAKMLEVARLFGNGGKRNQPALAESVGSKYYNYDSQEFLDETGMIYGGYFLDKGLYTVSKPYVEFMINSASPNKEGAWEFLNFLLSEEIQSTITYQYEPVHRYAFDCVVEREIVEGSYIKGENGLGSINKAGVAAMRAVTMKNPVGNHNLIIQNYKALYDLTEEKAEEIKSRIERAISLPHCTEEIIDIICEEATAYFNETANSADVCENIQRRVQQYLDEVK